MVDSITKGKGYKINSGMGGTFNVKIHEFIGHHSVRVEILNPGWEGTTVVLKSDLMDK